MDKLIVILGPTASGKTQLAVELASKYNAEIISADSRQIYKGMDIGTGKDLNEYTVNNLAIPYHLIDIISPKEDYSVFQFKKDFNKSYDNIISKNKLPILCGGTGFYIESILLNYNISKTKPNYTLREKLENKKKSELKTQLMEIDKTAFNPEYHISKRRLIRSIEILSDNNLINMKKIGEDRLNNSLIIGLDIKKMSLWFTNNKKKPHKRLFLFIWILYFINMSF